LIGVWGLRIWSFVRKKSSFWDLPSDDDHPVDAWEKSPYKRFSGGLRIS
jgi:hypothetical protein